MAEKKAGQIVELKWDKATCEGFIRDFFKFVSDAELSGVPRPVIEGACRDFLGYIEGMRLAGSLKEAWVANMGVQAFQFTTAADRAKP